MKPTILSLHPTFNCVNNCAGCYLKREKSKEKKSEKHWSFFAGLIEEAKRLNFKEVAVAINEVNEKYNKETNYENNYLELKKRTKDLGMRFTVTTNYQFVQRFPEVMIDVNGLDLISISINEYATRNDEQKNEAIEIIKKLKQANVKVNANVLLSENMIKDLLNGWMNKILEVSDSVYLLLNKPTNMKKEQVLKMFFKLEDFIQNEKVILDSCVRCFNDLTDGICDKYNTVYVNPYGELKLCPYLMNEKRFTLDSFKDFEKVYNEAIKDVNIPCSNLFQR